MKNSVIYEVNMKPEANLVSIFLPWLKHHIGEMETIEGFLPSTQVFQDLDGEELSISVQYRLKSLKHLEIYFDKHAEKMRGDLPEEWRSRIQFSRRCLEQFLL